MNIQYRVPMQDEIEKISEQVMVSYTSAYQGMMDAQFLSSLSPNHWVTILRESLENGDICIIAEHSGKIVGSTVFSKISDAGYIYAEWHAFYLLPQYIGHGIGHCFYEKIQEEMIKQGCQSCTLEVLSANKHAIRFYLSHGYTKTSTFTVQENSMTLSCDKMTKEFT